MRLTCFVQLLLVVGSTAEAVAGIPHFLLVSPFFGSPVTTIDKSNHKTNESTSARMVVKSESVKRDLSSIVPKRRRRRLYGASRGKGRWKTNFQKQEALGIVFEDHYTSRTVDVIIDPMGNNRELQTTSRSYQRCQDAIALEQEVGSEFGTICSCQQDFNTLSTTLECTDSRCAYCNLAETVCTGYTYGVTFDRNGDDVEYFEEDAYTLGREGAIRYTESEEQCSVTIGGTKCSQCSMQDCSDGYYGVNVLCENVEDGAIYNSCTESFSTTGIFEAFNDNEFEKCYSNLEVCHLGRSFLDSRFECFCDNDANTIDISSMTCEDSCEYCNNNLEICAKENYEQTYTNTRFSASKRTVQYSHGRSELVTLEESNCESAKGCQDCSMNVDGVLCESCSMKTCSNGTKAAIVGCSNIDSSLSSVVDFCDAGPALSDTVLEFFSVNFTKSCIMKQKMACRDAKDLYEQHAHKYVCDCVDQADGSTELQCKATCGDLCNDEETVCVRESFLQDFLPDGSSSFFRKDIKYTQGRKETLTYTEFINGGCSMKIDGVGCRSCVINACQGNPLAEKAPLIDCSDFEGGAILDLCQTDIRVETGIFERFSIEEFQQCLDRTPANGVCQSHVAVTTLPYQTTGSTLMVASDNVKSCGSAQSFAPGLWYKVVGTGNGMEASICEPEADFNAHVSVFTGSSCSNLTCSAASQTSCKVEWTSHKGTKYYVRVHGVGGQIGNFNLSLRELSYGSTACMGNKTFFESDPNFHTSCNACTSPDENGYVDLRCSVDCNTCDKSGSICANQTMSTKFDKTGRIIEHRQHYDYVSGRDETVTLTKFGCSEHGVCQTCEVAIGNSTCESCQLVGCSNSQTGNLEIVATCGSTTINSCNTSAADTAGVLQALADSTYDQCYSRDPTVACLDYKEFEEDLEGGIICNCEAPGDGEDTNLHLVCRRQSCLRCNQDRSLCGYDTFGVVFDDAFGRVSHRFEGFQYIEGRNDSLVYHISNAARQIDGTCVMAINNEPCDSCVVSQCNGDTEDIVEVGHFHGIGFDCQNLPGGIYYDGCSVISLPNEYEVIKNSVFDTCVDIATPQEACQNLQLQTAIARSGGKKDSCNCTLSDTGYYELICSDREGCQVCTDESAKSCADYTEHRVELNHFGMAATKIDSYQWVTGHRIERLVIRDEEKECQVMIDGELCSSCVYANCSSNTNTLGRKINCTNLLGTNGTFGCGKGHEVFTPIFDEVHWKCPEVKTPTRAPVVPPTKAPTSSPTESPTSFPSIPSPTGTASAPPINVVSPLTAKSGGVCPPMFAAWIAASLFLGMLFL